MSHVRLEDFEAHPVVFENVSYETFIQLCSEFFEATTDETTTLESAEGGFKCISLHWLSRSTDWTDVELHESLILLDKVNKRLNDIEVLHDIGMLKVSS